MGAVGGDDDTRRPGGVGRADGGGEAGCAGEAGGAGGAVRADQE
jgi:hypothetical protein